MTHNRPTDYIAEGVGVSMLLFCLIVIAASVLSGCSSVLKDLPPGSNVQVSTTGFRVSPQAIDGPFIVGQSTYQLQTPTPEGSGPALNRTAVKATLTGRRHQINWSRLVQSANRSKRPAEPSRSKFFSAIQTRRLRLRPFRFSNPAPLPLVNNTLAEPVLIRSARSHKGM